MSLHYNDIDILADEIERASKDEHCSVIARFDFKDYSVFDKYLMAKLTEKNVNNAKVEYSCTGISVRFAR